MEIQMILMLDLNVIALVLWLHSNLRIRILIITLLLWQTLTFIGKINVTLLVSDFLLSLFLCLLNILVFLIGWNKKIYFLCSRDPELADVKLAQAKYLMSRLAQFKTLVSDKFECKPSIVVAGDFNSTPGDKVCEIFSFLIS